MKQARRFYFLLIVINVLLIAGTLAVFTFASGVSKKKSLEVSGLKAQVESNRQVLDNYVVLKKTLTKNKDLQTTVNKVLPTSVDQTLILAELDKFAKDTQLPLKQITFTTTTSKTGQTITAPSGISGVSVVSTALHIDKTKYENLLSFLREIEMNQRRMQVTSIAITPNSDNPKDLDKLDLTIDVYVKTEK